MAADPLARWKLARDAAATRLVQVIVEGDSTFAGEASDAVYSPITRLRQRLRDAGIPDGGHGVFNGTLDTQTVSLEPADAGVLQEPAYEINDGQNLKANYTGSTTTAGAIYQVAGYGTRVRVSFARYGSPTVLDIDIDGVTERINTGVNTNTGASTAETNWQAGGFYYKGGLAAGRHVITVTLVSGRMSVLVEVTGDTGVVLHNFAARGAQAVGVPWHQYQDWAGLQVSNTPPSTPASKDTRPGSHAAALGIFDKGINDQQGLGGGVNITNYQAKATDFARAFIAAGASAVICVPWFESANQSQHAPDYRAAAAQAAADTGALLVDLSNHPGGALEGYTEGAPVGGANDNPHLTKFAYELQGDHLADLLLAPYEGGLPIGGGRTALGYRSGGQARTVLGIRRNGVTTPL